MQFCSFGKYGICTRYIITLYSTSHSERPYFMLYQIMALSIRYPWEWIHARCALICQAYTPNAAASIRKEPRLLIISVQLSTARGFRAYFDLSTAGFWFFPMRRPGNALKKRRGFFQLLIDQRREEMRRDLATLHTCNLCLWELGGRCRYRGGVWERNSRSEQPVAVSIIMCPMSLVSHP